MRVSCTVGGIMFFNPLTQVDSHTHIVASVGAFQDIAGSALRLAHQGCARSGHSAQGGMAERVGFVNAWSFTLSETRVEPKSECLSFTLSETRVESKRTHRQLPLFLPTPAL